MKSNKNIEVVPYNSDWPNIFTQEAEKIKEALGDNCIEVHHIGSTSVPGLAAKPLIDILPVVKDIRLIEQAIPAMQELGYTAKGEHGIPFRYYFTKGPRTHNLHVFEEGNTEIDRHLKFRDYIKAHPEDSQLYAELKISLAEKFPNDMYAYCAGKDDLLIKLIANQDGKVIDLLSPLLLKNSKLQKL